jgi:NADH-quinone oxidoreductase subunit I
MADYQYSDLIYGKEDMLVDVVGTKPQRREAKITGKAVKPGYVVPYVRPELEGFQALTERRKP